MLFPYITICYLPSIIRKSQGGALYIDLLKNTILRCHHCLIKGLKLRHFFKSTVILLWYSNTNHIYSSPCERAWKETLFWPTIHVKRKGDHHLSQFVEQLYLKMPLIRWRTAYQKSVERSYREIELKAFQCTTVLGRTCNW